MSVTEVPVVAPEVTVSDEDLLLDAAALIEEYGWFQLSPCYGGDGLRQNCIMSAVLARCGGNANSGEWGRVYPYVHDVCGGNAWKWNDEPGRTKNEVVAKLREAARNARQ